MKSKNNIIVFAILQLLVVQASSQKIIDSFQVCNLPVREGIIYEHDRNCLGYLRCGEPGVSILTKYDSVFHLEEGKVLAIHFYGDGYAVVIKNEKDYFISYSNLKSVALKKGDVVKKGTWIGLAEIGDDGKDKQVDFLLLKKDKQLPFKKAVEYVRCNIPCELQNGYTL